MSIFDNMDPGQIAEAIDRQFGAGTSQGIMGSQSQPPEMPELSGGQSDVSGFANYGMTPPSLPDPIQQMTSLMDMMGDPHQNRKEDPFMQQQQGGLMAYLQQLGVV